MSNDPVLNSALFNFCNKLDNGPRSDAPREPRSLEDLEWLKQALAAIEAPDKILKQHLQVIENAMNWDSLKSKDTSKKKKVSEDTNEEADNKSKDAKQPTPLQQLASGATEVTLDDVLASLDYLVEELEDINMATEFCLMNGPSILLNLLQLSSAFYSPQASTTTTSANATASATVPAVVGTPALAVIPQQQQQAVNGPHIPRACGLKEPALGDLKRNAEVRAATAMAIAHAVQQNPKAQEAFAVCGWGAIVVPILAAEVDQYIHGFSPSAKSSTAGSVTGATVASLLHLCSCMSRENDDGTKEFIVRGGVPILEQILASPARVTSRILRRAMFLVEYFASIGISNKSLIQHVANILLITGPQQTLRVAASSSNQTNGSVSDPITSSVLVEDAETKNAVQSSAASCLMAIYEKGEAVVGDILKPMGVGAYLAKALPLMHLDESDIRHTLAKKLEG